MRQLYGLYKPDSGEIRLNDQTIEIHSPSDSLAQGIGMIHQHFMLVPTLSVTENVALGLQGGPLLGPWPRAQAPAGTVGGLWPQG